MVDVCPSSLPSLKHHFPSLHYYNSFSSPLPLVQVLWFSPTYMPAYNLTCITICLLGHFFFLFLFPKTIKRKNLVIKGNWMCMCVYKASKNLWGCNTQCVWGPHTMDKSAGHLMAVQITIKIGCVCDALTKRKSSHNLERGIERK